MTADPAQRPSRRRWIWLLVIAGGLLTIGWTVAWQLVAARSQATVDGWVEARRAAGETLEHGPMVLSGFPLSVDITVNAVHWSRKDGDTLLVGATPHLIVSATPWRPGTLVVQAPTGVRASVSGLLGTLTGDSARASFEIDLGRRAAEEIRFTLRDLDLTLPGDVALASVEWVRATVDPTPAADPNAGTGRPSRSLSVTAAVQGVLPAGVVDPPFDGRANGTLRAVMLGRIDPGDGVAGLAEWRDSGGALVIERLRLDWLPLDVTAEGDFTLDQLLRPEGDAVAEIRGLADTVDRLAARGRIEPGAAAVLKLAAAAFAKPASDGVGQVVRAPVRIRDGRLSIGSAVLARIGSIAQ
ncbi:MAG: DUF2125 domain-containing protein [Alphaproteobacteria bacterium]|nr:DUF2125 domain-containing protein [Alphaproteobacteria bacterium]